MITTPKKKAIEIAHSVAHHLQQHTPRKLLERLTAGHDRLETTMDTPRKRAGNLASSSLEFTQVIT
jgi:hypothetical protein